MKVAFDSVILITLLALCTKCTAQKHCYSPNGTIGDNVPCFPEAEVSFCCGYGWICTTDLLCVTPITPEPGANYSAIVRGTCTDQSWNSPACPSFCRTDAYSDHGVQSIWSCGDEEYECTPPEGVSPCQSNATFHLDAFQNVTTIGGSTGNAFTTALSGSSSSSPSSRPASSPARTTSTSTSATSPPPQVSATASSLASHNSLSGGAKAGIAVGVIAGSIVVTVVAYFIMRQTKTNRQLRQHIEGLYNRGPTDSAYRDERSPADDARNHQNGISELQVIQQAKSTHELEARERPMEIQA